MAKKVIAPKEVQAIITYLGLEGYLPDINHVYMVNDNEKRATFGRKLQKHHRIGLSYPVIIEGNSFKTKRSDLSIDKPGFKVTARQVAECVRTTEVIQAYIKQRNEEKKLEKIARDFAEKMRPIYKRADGHG